MTRKQPRERRVRSIIEASVDELLDKGFEGASMQSIADRAGLTKGGLYHHFKSKDEILLAANEHLWQPMLTLMAEAQEEPDADRGLRSYLRRSLQHWIDHPRAVIFTFLSWSKIMSVPDAWPRLDSYTELMTAFFESLLSRGVTEGRYREHDSHSRALALMAALDGITAYLLTSRELTVEAVVETFERVFLDELIAPEGRS